MTTSIAALTEIDPAILHATGFAVVIANSASGEYWRGHVLDLTAEQSETAPRALCRFAPRSGWMEVGIPSSWPGYAASCPRCITRWRHTASQERN
jgi:hypothetical protein